MSDWKNYIPFYGMYNYMKTIFEGEPTVVDDVFVGVYHGIILGLLIALVA